MSKFFDLFKKSRIGNHTSRNDSIAYQKYSSFKKLLVSNNRSLKIIADLENIIYQDKPIAFFYAQKKLKELTGEVFSIVEDINSLTNVRYPELFDAADRISDIVLAELTKKKKLDKTNLVLGLERLSKGNENNVGGKAANLGEVYNRVHLPVPPGFAVTAYACQQFLEYNNLIELIDNKLGQLEVNDTEQLILISKEIRSRIMKAKVSDELKKAIAQAVCNLKEKIGQDFRLSVRSSATSEDSEASFAGQHATVLNVREENLIQAYVEVVSSAFSPRAIFYRRKKGYRDQDVIMSVACIMMVDAKVSGVVYTVDPNDSRNSVIMISAVWGLAICAVEGSTDTDFYRISKKNRTVESAEIVTKKTQLKPDITSGIKEELVAEELKNKSSLNPSQIDSLVDYALRLEKHYGYALDIEWVIDQNDKLFILQARSLKRSQQFNRAVISDETEKKQELSIVEHPILLKGGASASEGTATGLAYVVESDHTLHHIPDGAIVIVRQTSPRYVPLMGHIRAIVTDVGSIAGHMACVAREFHLPALVGAATATKIIRSGEEITVDATNRIIYKGRVEQLLIEKPAINPMKGSPVYKIVRSILKRIAPLYLIDPKKENFRPDACETFHDIIRFAHEMAMRAMFRISDNCESEKTIAIPLRVFLPFNIYAVDLGGGLTAMHDAEFVTINDVTSVPLNALLKGMKHKNVDWAHDTGVKFRGFVSIVAESVFRDPMKEGCMGGPNYAIIAKNYLNFNSRLGYHFATIDTFCGPVLNNNYIIFSFKGGAADIGRRSRRALLIALILKGLDFKVEQTGDMVKGEIKKYNQKTIQKKLDMLGRLLGSVRLLDMILSDDGAVEWYAAQFFKGNYTFQTDSA